MVRYKKQAGYGLLGGIIHLATVGVFIFSYVTLSGFSFSLRSPGAGLVPIAVLFVLGAVCSLLYFDYDVISPIGIIILFDVSTVFATHPAAWTTPGPAGPPSFFIFYIILFVVPLGIAVLMGGIEYWTRTRWKGEATNPT